MAIYSLSHKSIGKSTQADRYTASAHILYITRTRALHHIEAERMPQNGEHAADWMRHQEDHDRANARVVDKVMLALPRELSPSQRVALVRDFAESVSKGRAPWLAAFHDNTEEAHNPHCHLVFRDRDPETRKRVVGFSEKGSTDRLRVAWESHTNEALRLAKRPERIDRRTLEAQGVARRPTIHEGVRARRMARDGRRPRSRNRRFRNGFGARQRERVVDYRKIDQGRSRGDYNAAITAAKPSPAQERDYWEVLEQDRTRKDLEDLRRIHRPEPDERERRVLDLMEARKLRLKMKRGPPR